MSKTAELPFPWNHIEPKIPGSFKIIFPDPTENGIPHRYSIDTTKGLSFLLPLYFMSRFNAYDNPTMWTYAALHGTYGLLWLTKSMLFPDRKWEKKLPWHQVLVVFSGLGTFWITPYRIAALGIQHSPMYLGLVVSAYTWGIFFHFVSDIHKDIALQLNPGHLITSKLFAVCRHPNYFGEFLIYMSFVFLGDSWLMILYALVYMTIYWVPNIIWKETSMSRYESWKAYCKDTALFFPYLYFGLNK